ncbi:MAG: hypothetical protein QF793_00335 [Candidatus Peribacteraceae bacterium]|nr:hypothetical protein [Candidatus Peribacteraceae bacterium]
MKLQKMFKRAVEIGMQADVREKKYFDRYFKKQKDAMKSAKGWKKDIFTKSERGTRTQTVALSMEKVPKR